jgi:hypothetical protein
MRLLFPLLAGLLAQPLNAYLELLEGTTAFNYATAKARCGSVLGGELAKIDTQADYDQAMGFILATTLGNKQAWIGLDDIATEGVFVYTEDGSVVGAFQVRLFLFASHVRTRYHQNNSLLLLWMDFCLQFTLIYTFGDLCSV